MVFIDRLVWSLPEDLGISEEEKPKSWKQKNSDFIFNLIKYFITIITFINYIYNLIFIINLLIL